MKQISEMADGIVRRSLRHRYITQKVLRDAVDVLTADAETLLAFRTVAEVIGEQVEGLEGELKGRRIPLKAVRKIPETDKRGQKGK